MKKNTKILIGILCVVIVGVTLNISNIRKTIGRIVKSVSVVDARKELQQMIEREYPEYDDLKLTYEGYPRLTDGSDNLMCYTVNYTSQAESDIVIEGVYCDQDYTNVFTGNETIDNGRMWLERKRPLINRFVGEYHTLSAKRLVPYFSDYLYTSNDIEVSSKYTDKDYAAALPEGLENGMKFDAEIPLAYVLTITLHMEDDSWGALLNALQDVYDASIAENLYFEEYNIHIIKGEKEITSIQYVPAALLEDDSIQTMIEQQDFSGSQIEVAYQQPYSAWE